MKSLGIDVGSRTIKTVVTENNKIIHSNVMKNTYDHEILLPKIISQIEHDNLTATGYGRHFFSTSEDHDIITEIKAFAIGINHILPDARTILDIGGQDTKAILLDQRGRVKKFVMNDKCAAGTGRFLEIMATALNFDIADFGKAALKSESSEKINNMCTVFAESEVISLLSKGASRENVARGIHESVVKRSMIMLHKIGIQESFVFAGGVAFNPAMQKLVEKEIGMKTLIPDNPQIVGALGCAIYGERNS